MYVRDVEVPRYRGASLDYSHPSEKAIKLEILVPTKQFQHVSTPRRVRISFGSSGGPHLLSVPLPLSFKSPEEIAVRCMWFLFLFQVLFASFVSIYGELIHSLPVIDEAIDRFLPLVTHKIDASCARAHINDTNIWITPRVFLA